MKTNKGGRPREEGARKPSGDLKPKIDLGSPYLLLRRAEALGHDCTNIMDMRKLVEMQDHRASHQLGILHVRHVITGEQAFAGRRYASTYAQTVQRPHVRTGGALMVAASTGGAYASILDSVGEETDDDREERLANLRKDYLSLRNMLIKCGQHVVAVIDRVCVFDESPRLAHYDPLKRGLDTLICGLQIIGKR